jgi:hypothetical protein
MARALLRLADACCSGSAAASARPAMRAPELDSRPYAPLSGAEHLIAMVAVGTVRRTCDMDGAGNICHHNGRRWRRHGSRGVFAVSHGNSDDLKFRSGFASGLVATALRHGLPHRLRSYNRAVWPQRDEPHAITNRLVVRQRRPQSPLPILISCHRSHATDRTG